MNDDNWSSNAWKCPETSDLRRQCSDELLWQSAAAGIPFKKPDRFGKGKTMVIAELPEFRQSTASGNLDIAATLQYLRGITEFMDTVNWS